MDHSTLEQGHGMRIWIDADAAPRDVKDIVFRASLRLKLPVTLVANQRVTLPPNNPLLTAVWVRGGPDEADQHIAEHAQPGDLAVTADIPLAAALVARDVVALDFRGEIYSEGNIGERLSVRDFMASLRDVGIQTGGPSPYGTREKQAFAGALDRTLVRLLKRAGEDEK
jgi:uncharacterized protein YaiI (UPF0178 family)